MNYTAEGLKNWAVAHLTTSHLHHTGIYNVRHIVDDCLELHAHIAELEAEVARLTAENATLRLNLKRAEKDWES